MARLRPLATISRQAGLVECSGLRRLAAARDERLAARRSARSANQPPSAGCSPLRLRARVALRLVPRPCARSVARLSVEPPSSAASIPRAPFSAGVSAPRGVLPAGVAVAPAPACGVGARFAPSGQSWPAPFGAPPLPPWVGARAFRPQCAPAALALRVAC